MWGLEGGAEVQALSRVVSEAPLDRNGLLLAVVVVVLLSRVRLFSFLGTSSLTLRDVYPDHGGSFSQPELPSGLPSFIFSQFSHFCLVFVFSWDTQLSCLSYFMALISSPFPSIFLNRSFIEI